MKKILIVEDCSIQANIIQEIISRALPSVHILIANSFDLALSLSKKNNIDLFLIDIGLGLDQKTGIELAEELRSFEKYSLAWMVFISAHSKQMLKAFKKINCYDFITKPFEASEIQKTVIRLLGCGKSKLTDQSYYFFITANNLETRIEKSDIYFIEIDNRKCIIHAKSGQFFTQRKSLLDIVNEINMKCLIQSHKSFYVNITKIKRIIRNKPSSEILFHDYDKTALLGRRFASINKKTFRSNSWG
ncbi:response regulator transcription factor [bacterium AH-315-K05]|nr:response regulator transcription factor [bacterium AH-315-L21]MBN4056615.1 response regulator transcription factor [bacterium AH-315-K05]MBN4074322.1 response regulator transcription factor [bacterium AH-315-E09]